DGASVRVRMGLHTGEAVRGTEGWIGYAVHHAARVGDVAHGGQVVLSGATVLHADTGFPADVRIVHLGVHRLQGAEQPERLYQLAIEGLPDSFPPLAPALALASAEERAELLNGPAALAAPLFDVAVPAAELGAEEDVSFAMLHGLYWIVANLASQQPLVLAVDDLHWCDAPSLRFLAYLVRRMETLPVLVAMGLRTAEPGVDELLLGEVTSDPLAV